MTPAEEQQLTHYLKILFAVSFTGLVVVLAALGFVIWATVQS